MFSLNRLPDSHEPDLVAKYAYDGNGLRMQKSVNGRRNYAIWDGSQIALERTPTGLRLYYYGLGRYASRDEADALVGSRTVSTCIMQFSI